MKARASESESAGDTPSILVAQLGARMHYAVPRILHEAGMLHRLYTDIYARSPGVRWMNHLPASVLPEPAVRLLDRVPHGVPHERVTSFPRLGLRYAFDLYAASSLAERLETFLSGGAAFTERIIETEPRGMAGVYTFNTAGLELLRWARDRGVTAIMEQTIAPAEVEHRLLREEYEAHPAWQPPPEDNPFLAQKVERERQEWAETDVILCGSSFVKEAVGACGGPEERCVVVPYGIDLEQFEGSGQKEPHDPIRVLTAGAMGLRKGTPYVLEAARRLRGAAQFRLVGSLNNVEPEARAELSDSTQLLGQVPTSEMADHYAWADVFLLPSICEGSATVTYEALASGLPVICTPNTGSIVQDEREGFIVPIRSVDGILESIDTLARNPTTYRRMSRRARHRAQEVGGVEAYARRLVKAVKKAVDSSS